MNVCHISTYDVAGGAARAAYRLHRGLLEQGVASRMLVTSKSSHDQTVETLPSLKAKSLTRRLFEERWARFQRERRLKDGGPDETYHDHRAPFRVEDFEGIQQADIVHLHWTSNLLDWPEVLPWLAREKPLVWTLHDMNPFLGVMHYQDPHAQTPHAFGEWDEGIRKQKRDILHAIASDRLQIIAPS
ncbi:MAG: glycosyltransferase, partial [Planctomycetota bacterium]